MKNRIGNWLSALVLLATLPSVPGSDVQVPWAVPRKLETFDYRGVTLENGPLLRQVLEVREDYLGVPNDDYLKGFRRRAGKSAPGEDLGGWYRTGTFHVFGQVLSGLARLHAATGDPECRAKLEALVRGWAACREADGYFFSTRPPAPAHYIYEKMVGGLLDAHVYGGIDGALEHLAAITGWAEKNLDRSNPYVVNTLAGISEWYTLSENLYRAYLVTGARRYREFAKAWEYPRYWDLFAESGANPFSNTRGYHAYSHVNTLCGAAMAYAVEGESRHLDIVRNAFDVLQRHQVFVTGGYGPGERFVPESLLLDYVDVMENHFETQCGSWAAFKLSKYLLQFTGEGRYGDWIERLVLNGIGATLPRSGDGRVLYYAGYGPSGACKTHNMPAWSCCAGTRIQAVADYHDLVFFRDADGLAVNLFTPASVGWNQGDVAVMVRQETRFPRSEEVVLRVTPSRPATFALRVRNPGWIAGPMEVRVNDQAFAAETLPSRWVSVRREWKYGDVVRLRLPMQLSTEPFPADSTRSRPVALAYGPVAMACRSARGNPVSRLDMAAPVTAFEAIPDEPLHFRAKSDPDVLLKPLADFREGERYFLYLDPRHPWTGHRWNELTFSAGWTTNITEDLRVTDRAGEQVEFAFSGTRARWIARKSDDGGRAEVFVDGCSLGIVDQFDPEKDRPFRHEVRDLAPGRHVLRVVALGTRNESAKGSLVGVGRIDVIEE